MAKKVMAKKYQITSNILMEGYFSTIESRDFAVTKGETKITFTENGKQVRKLMPGSVFESGKPTEKDYFEDLSDMQIHELYVAGVIELDDTQKKAYDKFIIEFYK